MYHQRIFNTFKNKEVNQGLFYYKYTPAFIGNEPDKKKKWLENFINLQSDNTVL